MYLKYISVSIYNCRFCIILSFSTSWSRVSTLSTATVKWATAPFILDCRVSAVPSARRDITLSTTLVLMALSLKGCHEELNNFFWAVRDTYSARKIAHITSTTLSAKCMVVPTQVSLWNTTVNSAYQDISIPSDFNIQHYFKYSES